ncbi:Oxidoreductase-like domain-containing protein [Mycena venus]|uniref:Oxidoreductase-like domain-containing protein n=1 Tax=Mycena venus TaxID=2733690 RepID=A0A8H6Y1L0_9AGAR|nr:Oxidoreductase-like domain-containing protein [Mycena venus]
MFPILHTGRRVSLSIRRYFALDSGAIERIKKPTRGGQNLSLRYRRLEQSLRGKEALQRDIDALESDVAGHFKDTSTAAETTEANRYFRGLEIPRQPKAPQSDECCMSGCAVCVYDLYEESLAAYKESLAAFMSALTSAGIPQEAWPKSVRTIDTTEPKKSVTLSAFEELERSLKAKRETETLVPRSNKRPRPTWTMAELYEVLPLTDVPACKLRAPQHPRINISQVFQKFSE